MHCFLKGILIYPQKKKESDALSVWEQLYT